MDLTLSWREVRFVAREVGRKCAVGRRVAGDVKLPAFLTANNLKPFISEWFGGDV